MRKNNRRLDLTWSQGIFPDEEVFKVRYERGERIAEVENRRRTSQLI